MFSLQAMNMFASNISVFVKPISWQLQEARVETNKVCTMYEFITMFGPRVLGAAAAELEDAMLNDWQW